MSAVEFCRSLRGVFGFPVTPLRRDLSVDLDGLAANVDQMASHAFCAIVVAGGAGEMHGLLPDEIESVARTAVDAVNSRMPVICGTGFSAALGSDIARRAERAGVEALLALPPYYANAPEAGLVAYYEALGRSTALPLIVYSRDNAIFTPEGAALLCDRVPRVGGWKDGQSDLRLLRRIMQRVGGRISFYGGMGDDYAGEYRAIGTQAYTSSLSNIAPKLAVELATCSAARQAELLTAYVQPFFELRARMKGYEVSLVKAAMELLGAPAGPVRPPLPTVRPGDGDDLRQLLERWTDVL